MIESPLKLCIVIPVYNRQEGLDKLLLGLSTSVVSRGFEEKIEVIVIDDDSEKLVKLQNDYPFKVKFERNDQNLGAPSSRERGFHLSKAPFIHFHDSDDSVSKYWLTRLVDALDENLKIDILLTARTDIDRNNKTYKLQNFFDSNYNNSIKISKRLIYRNCMGPLGGVTFSRQVLEKIEFKNFASCQDWQMYIDAIKHSKVLVSRPDIKFIFNKTGDDRISHNPRKKILGHLQLSKITSKESIFKRNIRLFYLYTCKQHIYNKGGSILKFYKKNRIKIFATFIVISLYWRLT